MSIQRLSFHILALVLFGLLFVVLCVGFVWFYLPIKKSEVFLDPDSFRMNGDGSLTALAYRNVTDVTRKLGSKGVEPVTQFSGRQVLLVKWAPTSNPSVTTEEVGELLKTDPQKSELKGWTTKDSESPSVLVWQADLSKSEVRLSSWRLIRSAFEPCDYVPSLWTITRSHNGRFVLAGQPGRIKVLHAPDFVVAYALTTNQEIMQILNKREGRLYLSNDGRFVGKVTLGPKQSLLLDTIDLTNARCSQAEYANPKLLWREVIGFDHAGTTLLFALASADPDRPPSINPAVFQLVSESGQELNRIPLPPELNMGRARTFSWNPAEQCFERTDEEHGAISVIRVMHDGTVVRRRHMIPHLR